MPNGVDNRGRLNTSLVLSSIRNKLELMQRWDEGTVIWTKAAAALATEVRLLDTVLSNDEADIPGPWINPQHITRPEKRDS